MPVDTLHRRNICAARRRALLRRGPLTATRSGARRCGLQGTGAFAGDSAFGRTAQIRKHGPNRGMPTLLTPYQRHTTRRLCQCHC